MPTFFHRLVLFYSWNSHKFCSEKNFFFNFARKSPWKHCSLPLQRIKHSRHKHRARFRARIRSKIFISTAIQTVSLFSINNFLYGARSLFSASILTQVAACSNLFIFLLCYIIFFCCHAASIIACCCNICAISIATNYFFFNSFTKIEEQQPSTTMKSDRKRKEREKEREGENIIYRYSPSHV